MKPIPIILLCLMLSACASQQIKPTSLPEITITYEAQMTDEEIASINNAIMEAISCDLPDTTITIIIKEYYTPDPLRQFVGMPYKGFYILAYVTVSTIGQETYSFNMNGKVANVGLVSGGVLLGVPGVVIGVANLARDIHNAETSLAYKIWKKICRIYNKGTTQNTP